MILLHARSDVGSSFKNHKLAASRAPSGQWTINIEEGLTASVSFVLNRCADTK